MAIGAPPVTIKACKSFNGLATCPILTACLCYQPPSCSLTSSPALSAPRSARLGVQLPGFYLSFQLGLQTIVALVVAGLTASGADWLLHDHPALGKRSTLQHWLLPALTAWVIELPLSQLPLGPLWWLGFLLGGLLIVLVLVAEYIVVDPDDARYLPASATLTAVSFTLYLVLAAALRFAGLRLYLLLPALMLGGFLVSLRAFQLRLPGKSRLLQAGVIAFITTQLAAVLHYWPLSPVSFALALLAPAYALTGLIENLEEGESGLQVLIEPGLIILLIWGIALWLN